jgi:hypothetical protein
LVTAIAALPEAERDALLLSADRFANMPNASAPAAERVRLLGRLGLFGARHAVSLVGSGRVATASALSAALIEVSGLRELRRILASRFAARADVLKARSALLTVEAVLRSLGDQSSGLATDVERIRSSTHEFAEMRLQTALRTTDVGFQAEEATEAERLLGVTGTDPGSRAGVDAGATTEEIRSVLMDAVNRWRRKAESPLSSRVVVDAARVVVRSCEGALGELNASR